MNCSKCKEQKVIKNGRTKNNKQQYYCKMCSHRFIEYYTNQAYKLDINEKIVQLTKEGLGIRSTARILEISATTLLKRIVCIARNIIRPNISRGKTRSRRYIDNDRADLQSVPTKNINRNRKKL